MVAFEGGGSRMVVLDHGYVQLIESWGSDQLIVESARMSTQKGFNGWGPICPHGNSVGVCERDEACRNGTARSTPGDEKLLRYMWENRHDTPFEFGGMIVEVKAPLCVFREWHRHRSQGYSEASARFAPLPDDDYMPTVERLMLSGGANKQAGKAAGAAELTETDALAWLAELAEVYAHAERVYQRGLAIGVPKELARLSMTVGRYSKMRATTNLRMWLAFASLRSTGKNPHAQWEIRQYADVVCTFLQHLFPRTLELFESGSR